ncbi:MAG: hypothetical protein HZY74_05465 [Brevundimonas sp.]|nr:MAG: hypothetical protein HZY74_05465 [Brevundimonas sp.]
MRQTTAADLYQQFVALIDEACASKDVYAVPKAAAAAGMEGGETPHGLSQRWDYTFVDLLGQTLLVHARWWDQSQAFSIRPDMHVMSVELKAGDTIARHKRRYEE